MPKKLTTEEFINRARKIHGDKYDYSKVQYTKNNIEVIITCPIHSDFKQTPNKHLIGHGCDKCGKETAHNKLRKSQEQFINECKQIHGDRYDYSITEYNGSSDCINVICPIHGLFTLQANHHLEGQGCSKCKKSRVKVSKRETKKVTSLENFIKQSTIIHQGKYMYDKSIYKGTKTPLIITCPIHGDFLQSPSQHLQGYGCDMCGRNKISQHKLMTTEEFITKANVKHLYKYSYDKTDLNNKDNKGRVIINCPVHGDFPQRPIPHLQGQGCPFCKQSHMEELIMKELIENNIQFEYQKRLEWLGLQSLDFYLPQSNIAIECQGRQHFEEISHFGGKQGLHNAISRDIRKKNLCNEHSVKILYFCNDKRCANKTLFGLKVYSNPNELIEEIKKD